MHRYVAVLAPILSLYIASSLMGCERQAADSEPKLARAEDAEGRYPAVVALRNAANATDPTSVACTATFIAPRILLSAAHCVTHPWSPNEGLRPIYFGADKLTRVYIPAGFATGQASPDEPDEAIAVQAYRKWDLAVLVLDADAAPTTMSIAAAAPTQGERVLLVGYGHSTVHCTPGDTCGVAGDPGRKRAGQTTISQVTQLLHSSSDVASTAPGNAALGGGDSGGPLFTINGSGEPQALAGIASGGGGTRVGTTILENLHVNLRSNEAQEFFDWLAVAPRCLGVAGRSPAQGCVAAENDGRLPAAAEQPDAAATEREPGEGK